MTNKKKLKNPAAVALGRLGGLSTSKDRDHMASIGAKGGAAGKGVKKPKGEEMKPILTRELAWAAAKDAAAANMRHNGRKHWNQDDYNTMAETFDRLWPEELDQSESAQASGRRSTASNLPFR